MVCRHFLATVSPDAKVQEATLPSRELTYPTLGKEESSSKSTFQRICMDMLVPRRVSLGGSDY